MLKMIIAVTEFFKRFFKIEEIQYFDLLDEYEEYVIGQDVKVRNTLVGAVRSVRQYQVNYENFFYHIPEGYIESPEDVEYVALYRSKNLFGKEEAGIVHYGKVFSYSLVERNSITELPSPESKEKYYRFEISEWFTLKHPVKPREYWPHVCLMTNRFLIENALFVNELLISDNNEYKLHRGLIDITNGVYDAFFVKNSRVRVKGAKIIVVAPDVKKRYRISEYRSAPIGTLKNISNSVYDKDSQL